MPYLTAPIQAPAKVEVAPIAPAVAPVAAPAPIVTEIVNAPVITKYHSQDEFGQYAFGYSEPGANRDETRDANGVVKGSYNYVDVNGVPQSVVYVSDANGFQVSATNLPKAPVPVVDTPEVAAAKEAHLK